MTSGIDVVENTIPTALVDTNAFWDCWQPATSTQSEWKDFALLRSLPNFFGFGYDFSVLRGYNRSEIVALFEFFGGIEEPKSFAKVYEQFQDWDRTLASSLRTGKTRKVINRISLVSKLLTMWRPMDFAMWDTYARAGLYRLRGETRGTAYYRNDIETYERFRNDFFESFASVHELLYATSKRQIGSKDAEIFAVRLFDSVLMRMGGF